VQGHSKQVRFKRGEYVGESAPYWQDSDRLNSINVWQRYASPVWFDIRQTNVLQYREARSEDDTKHICPLQLDVIERSIHLWSNPGDLVMSPFTGIGSEGYCAVKMRRKFIGSELKPEYCKVAIKNLNRALSMCEEGADLFLSAKD
jgi:DNA modification methylase